MAFLKSGICENNYGGSSRTVKTVLLLFFVYLILTDTFKKRTMLLR